MTIKSITLRGALAGLAAAATAPLAAQTLAPEIIACYDSRTSSTGTPQGTGVVYRIKVPGVVAQQGCVDPRHTQFSWTIQHGALKGLGPPADDHPQYLLVSGARALTGNLSAGGNKITGLGEATAAGDAVRYEQAVKSGEPAGGDLAGPYPNPKVDGLQGRAVSDAEPAEGNVLTFNRQTSTWEPKPPPAPTPLPVPFGSENVPGTLVQRHPTTSGFAAGPVQVSTLTASGATNVAGNLTVNADATVSGSVTASKFNGDGSGLTNVTASGTSANTPNTLVQRDASGGFAAGPVTLTRLDVKGTALQSGFVVTGVPGGAIPATGAGSRLMWHPGRSAFRAGQARGGEWNDANVGLFSVAMGEGTTAFGDRSTAIGDGTTAQASTSLVIGQFNVVAGDPKNWVSTDPLFVAGNGSGLSSPSNALTLFKNGDLRISGTMSLGRLGQSGSIPLCSNFGFEISFCSSSLRYKTQVLPFSAGLEVLGRLRPVSFTWRDSEQRDLGLIAEEVERAEPLLVTRNEKGDVEGVKYDRLSVVVINAIRQQQRQIEQQQAQIESLKQLVCSAHPSAGICK